VQNTRIRSVLSSSALTRWALLAILALAIYLRFQNVNAIQHNVDHAYPIWQALTTLERGELPIIGQFTSVLIPNPALTGYLLLPWVALTCSPLGAYLFVIALNSLAVWLVFRVTTLVLSEAHALIAAFLMSVNPWVVEYSRTTWVQALIPFFACLVFWLLIPVLLGKAAKPGRRTILSFVALSAMTQTYLLAFVLVIPFAALLIVLRRRVVWRSVAVGAAIFGIVTGIYLAALVASHAWESERLNDFTDAHLSGEAWSHAVRLVTGENYAVSRGLDAPVNDWRLRETASEAAHALILIALLGGIVRALYGIWRKDCADLGLILLLWFAVPVLLLTYVSKPVHPFYLLLTLPAGYMLAAWGAGHVLRWRMGRLALVGASVIVAVLFSLNTLRFSEDTLAHPGANGPGVLPVGAGIDMARALLPPETHAPGAVVFADVDEWFLNSLSGSLFPVDRDLNVNQTTYLPAGGATYLMFSKSGSAPLSEPTGASDAATFPLSDGGLFRRYRVNLTIPGEQAIRSDRGITYLGMSLEQPLAPGQTTTLRTYWRVDELLPERGVWLFGPFVHVFEAAGKRVAIGTGAVVPGIRWRMGDVHVQRIAVSIPAASAGPFTLQIGQYDGVHNANAIFTLPDGTSSATIAVKPDIKP
jgi:4-amino-4-deoxy-L-arabinose transferase-like glycosyltransferase